jgi:hypothetical protein
LPGALCRRPEDFDLDDNVDPDAVADAIAVCHACPALNRRRRWLNSLPQREMAAI